MCPTEAGGCSPSIAANLSSSLWLASTPASKSAGISCSVSSPSDACRLSYSLINLQNNAQHRERFSLWQLKTLHQRLVSMAQTVLDAHLCKLQLPRTAQPYRLFCTRNCAALAQVSSKHSNDSGHPTLPIAPDAVPVLCSCQLIQDLAAYRLGCSVDQPNWLLHVS